MGYRSFRDSKGTEWQTWDVVPQLSDRRRSGRRSRTIQVVFVDRRARGDRRVARGQRPGLNGMDGGWLCFEAPAEKRRLAPIPQDWQQCPTTRLEEYCANAVVARRTSGAVLAPEMDR